MTQHHQPHSPFSPKNSSPFTIVDVDGPTSPKLRSEYALPPSGESIGQDLQRTLVALTGAKSIDSKSIGEVSVRLANVAQALNKSKIKKHLSEEDLELSRTTLCNLSAALRRPTSDGAQDSEQGVVEHLVFSSTTIFDIHASPSHQLKSLRDQIRDLQSQLTDSQDTVRQLTSLGESKAFVRGLVRLDPPRLRVAAKALKRLEAERDSEGKFMAELCALPMGTAVFELCVVDFTSQHGIEDEVAKQVAASLWSAKERTGALQGLQAMVCQYLSDAGCFMVQVRLHVAPDQPEPEVIPFRVSDYPFE